MSATIDERIVQMRFNNQQFESNAKTSLRTLDKLKNALSFGKASKELADFQRQTNGFSLSIIGDAVDSVASKFNYFEAIGLRVLNNIADSAYRTGVNLVKSLSVDNIAAGWSKYEDKTTSVATLVAQGYKMDEVDEQLDRLNWFTDETSYNFTEMVSNISKFTASGKGLKESVNAMEGIATWASLSGQNAATASRAMYQLSQAMGAGVMRKEDYKSIQNMSMDTDEFRQKALDAGVALGTLKKNSDGTYKSIVKAAGKVESFTKSQFAEHLTQDLWFNDKVMMKVFGDYGAAVDQIYEYSEKHGVTASEAIEKLGNKVDKFGLKAFKSAQEAKTWTDVIDSVKDAVSTGWMQTFELIFGNYEEAKKLWTDLANELYDVFAEGGNARNEMLGDWKELGGRTVLIEAFWTAWNGVANILSIVKEAFREIFPAMDAKKLFDITNAVNDLTRKFLELFEVPDRYKKLIKGGFDTESEGVKERFEAIIKRTDNLQKTFKGLFAILDIVKMAFSSIGQLAWKLVGSLLPVGDSILEVTGSFGDWAVNLRESLIETKFFERAVETLSPIFENVGSIIVWVIDKIKGAFSSIRGLFKPFTKEAEEVSDVVEEKWSPLETTLNVLQLAFKRIGEVFTALFPIFKQLGKALGTVWDNLHNNIMGVLNSTDLGADMSLVNGGIFGVLILALTNFINKIKDIIPDIDPERGIVGTIADSISSIMDAIKGDMADDDDYIIKMATAIAILAGSLFVISTVDTAKLISATAAIGALVYLIEDVMKKMSMLNSSSAISQENGGGLFGKFFGAFKQKVFSSSDIEKTSVAMLAIAGAIAVLAGAVFALSKLDIKQLGVGLIGVGALLAMIVVVAKYLSNLEGRIVKGASSLILISIAIRILASSVSKLGEMQVDQMVNGLMGVATLLLALGAFSKFAGDVKLGTGLGLLGIAAALVVISSAVTKLGSLDLEVLSQGMSSVAAIMFAFVVFSQTVKSKGLLKTATAMLIMSASLLIIGAAIKSLGKLDEASITRGAGGLAAALLTLSLVAVILASVKGTGKAALSILVMSSSLILLAGAFKIMASIPYTSLVKVILGIAAAMVILGVAGAVLAPLTGSILLLSLALVGISASLALAGLGLAALSTGLTTFATALLISGPILVKAITANVVAMLEACRTLIPLFVNVGYDVILNILLGIYNKLPEIVTIATLIVLKFLITIAQLLPLIIQTGVVVVVAFINGVANAIRENSGAIIGAVGNLLSSIFYLVLDVLEAIAETIPIVGGWLADGIRDFKGTIDENFSQEDIQAITEKGMAGATQGIENAKGSVEASASGISTASVDSLMSMVGGYGEVGQLSTEELIAALESGQDPAEVVAGLLSDKVVEGADKEQLKADMDTVGDYGGQGMNNGLKRYKTVVYNTGYDLGQAAVRGSRKGLEEKSPSKAMFQVGEYADQGLINGMLFLKDAVGDSAYDVATNAVDSLSAVLNDVSGIINSNLDFDASPTITPVLDLSNIQNGTNSINGMFANMRSFSLAATNGATFEANRLAQLNRIEATTTNADVVAALGLLRGDVNNLNESFLGTQVVLDSGALVGATARQMDNALGRIKVYKGRGI